MAQRLQTIFGAVVKGVAWLVPLSMVVSIGAAHVTIRRIRARHPLLTESTISALTNRYPQFMFLFALVEFITPGNVTKAIQIFQDQMKRNPFPLGRPYPRDEDSTEWPLQHLYPGLGDWDYIYSEAAALLQEKFSSNSRIYKPSSMLPKFAEAHPSMNLQQWVALKPILPVPEEWLIKEYYDVGVGAIPAVIQEFMQSENRSPVPLRPYWDSLMYGYVYNMEGLADWTFIYAEVDKDKPAVNTTDNPRYDLKSTAELVALLREGITDSAEANLGNAAVKAPSREIIRKLCRAQQLKFAPDKMARSGVTTGEDIKAAAARYQQINEICKELELRFPRK